MNQHNHYAAYEGEEQSMELKVTNVLELLRNDINRMEREVSKRQLEINKLKEILTHYRSLRRDQSQDQDQMRQPGRPRVSATKYSKVSAVKSEVFNLLKDGPKHRKEILNVLAEKQLLGNSESDLDYLSSQLSAWQDTMSDGKGNWYLRT